MSAELGVKAPNFELVSNSGDAVQLSKAVNDGPVVLAFFPLAFTGVCTEEMCEFRDGLRRFNDLNAQVFGISVDSRFALDIFAKQNNLKFPLLSDFNKEAATAFGCIYEDFLGLKGVAKRSVFVVDKDMMIRYRWVTDNAKEKPNQDEVAKAIAEL